MRAALEIDRQRLISQTAAWHNGLVGLLRKIVGGVSTVSLNAGSELSRAMTVFSDDDYNFYYIQECTDSDTLSFFRLFLDPEVLRSFRSFLESCSFSHRRLVILFSSSLLCFRFCPPPREFCPLCGKRWLWEHFFVCPKLHPIPEFSSSLRVLAEIKTHISHGQWNVFLHYLRFYLLEWSDILSQVAFPRDVIDSLC